jgi:hypothetical protein
VEKPHENGGGTRAAAVLLVMATYCAAAEIESTWPTIVDFAPYRAEIRWHAVSVTDERPAESALCGFTYEHGQLVPSRSWESTFVTIRCPNCQRLAAPSA